ncbi:DUF262 domain-containing protein [Micromonospora carbonacea]|uniref:GmrSD restriction endonucleases N-terminal domain-containing protein n=1 Tax=Micromonospora carbonacea TaxID=47853 RepID=A0A1C4YWG8_9ACTN|nr:DUF262 domain-containing protein [Micromonospora carbonacea]SCF25083.1 Protein of unknown function DUF262 [Micromonospora carbonacea]
MSQTEEDVEASEDETPEPLDLTADERKLVTQPYDYSVDQLTSHVEKGKIQLIEVPYQREYVWDDSKASRLMESLLLNVPIPVCYFAENEDGSWEVIDGLQRVHSIVRFLKGDIVLRGLSVLTELNGKRFHELPARDRRRIESRTLRFVVITEESHPDIKFDVFERLNTGAVKLAPQELRNCIYRGALNDALHELASETELGEVLGRNKDLRMRNEELALRFLALHGDLPGYKPPVTQFLNEYMRRNRSTGPSRQAVDSFRQTISTVRTVFKASAFRTLKEGKPSANINRAFFDAVTLSIAFADRDAVVAKADAVRRGHEGLLRNPDFLPLIGRATADRTRMHGRVRMYTRMLQDVGIRSNLPKLPNE